jgi:Fe-S oxidoreductase
MTKQRAFTYTTAFESVRQIGALIAPTELQYVSELPQNGAEIPFLLHLSCMALFTPHIPFLAQQILRRIGVDCPILGGPETCCGTLHKHFGDTKLEQQAAKSGLSNLRRGRPTTVLSICPDCDESFAKHTPSKNTFKVQNISQLFLTHLDALKKLMRPFDRRVVVHTHDVNEMRRKDAANVITILKAIPGLAVLPSQHAKGHGVHCNILGAMTLEDQAAMFAEAERLGADTIVVPYHSCYRQHLVMELRSPIKVNHYFELIADGLEVPFEETHKKLRLLDDIEKALDVLQPRIAQLGYDRDAVRPLLKWGVQLGLSRLPLTGGRHDRVDHHRQERGFHPRTA